MAVTFPHISPWFWGRSNNTGIGSSQEANINSQTQAQAQAENLHCSWLEDGATTLKDRRRHTARPKRAVARKPRRASRKWTEKQVDTEFDMVVVPPDGCCMSGSESDDSDWSVGWFEPHSSDFSDSEDNFAVLVPCYGSSSPRLAQNSFGNSKFLPDDPRTPVLTTMLSNLARRRTVADQRSQVEQWLASLQ